MGDTVQVYAQDRIGNASGEPRTLTVTGVAENYVGSYLYLGPSAWHSLGIQDQAADGWYATLPEDQETRDAFGEKLINQTGVATVDDVNEAIRTYRESLAVVNRVVAILVLWLQLCWHLSSCITSPISILKSALEKLQASKYLDLRVMKLMPMSLERLLCWPSLERSLDWF